MMKLNVKIEGQTYNVEIGDLSARPVVAVVDGESVEVFPEESGSQPAVSASALSSSAAAAAPAAVAPVAAPTGGAKVITAPIPGTIVSISVKAGDSVEFGQELCVLEAMKMKNAIRATRSGKIGVIHAAVGNQVRQGQPLVEFAE